MRLTVYHQGNLLNQFRYSHPARHWEIKHRSIFWSGRWNWTCIQKVALHKDPMKTRCGPWPRQYGTLGLAEHLLFWNLRLSTNLGKDLLLQLTLERLAENSLQWLRLGMFFKLPQDTTECRISWGWGCKRAGDVSNPGSSFFLAGKSMLLGWAA